MKPGPKRRPLKDRLLERYERDERGCWIWTGTRHPNGYGQIGRGGRGTGMTYAHRASYEVHVEPIPDGMELHHTCEQRACINPDHLEPMSHADHMKLSAKAQQTHCVHGHPFDEANTYVRPNGTRACRICKRERWAGWKARKKEAVA